jgi:hypothetical protein
MTIGDEGTSPCAVGKFSIWRTTDLPLITSPKTTCLPSRCGVGAVVMKNCEPLVFGPEFAIESRNGFSCLTGKASSSNLWP